MRAFDATGKAVYRPLLKPHLGFIHLRQGDGIFAARILAGLEALKPVDQDRLLRKLKRGQFSVADELDLHQMSAAVAREAIAQFLAESRRERHLCVKIIHGKGLRSRNEGPVLKRLVDSLLRRRADVLAFASAKANQGGTGAVIILLAD